jgi:hypothetical protein
MRLGKTVERRGWRCRVTALVGLAALVVFVVGRADAPWAQAGGRGPYLAAVEMSRDKLSAPRRTLRTSSTRGLPPC